MMDKFKVYISYWERGNDSRVHDKSVDYFLIDKFLEFHRKKNPNINFEFVLIENDKYKNGWWTLVKALNLLNLPQPFLHMDFDIFWDIDIEKVINYLLNENINCLYQSKDFLYTEYKRFSDYFNINDTPYCAGITWFNNIDTKIIETDIESLLNGFNLNLNQPWIGLGFEQLFIPHIIKKQNINIYTLPDIKENIRQFADFKNVNKPNNLLSNKWDDLYNKKSIIPELNYYHLMGEIKNIKSFIDDIDNWDFIKI